MLFTQSILINSIGFNNPQYLLNLKNLINLNYLKNEIIEEFDSVKYSLCLGWMMERRGSVRSPVEIFVETMIEDPLKDSGWRHELGVEHASRLRDKEVNRREECSRADLIGGGGVGGNDRSIHPGDARQRLCVIQELNRLSQLAEPLKDTLRPIIVLEDVVISHLVYFLTSSLFPFEFKVEVLVDSLPALELGTHLGGCIVVSSINKGDSSKVVCLVAV